MNSKQIEQNLGFLGQKLAEMQIKATILILGGAVMVTQIGNRRTTQDIDAVIATNDAATYRAVQQAIRLVTQEKKLASVWLNDDKTFQMLIPLVNSRRLRGAAGAEQSPGRRLPTVANVGWLCPGNTGLHSFYAWLLAMV